MVIFNSKLLVYQRVPPPWSSIEKMASTLYFQNSYHVRRDWARMAIRAETSEMIGGNHDPQSGLCLARFPMTVLVTFQFPCFSNDLKFPWFGYKIPIGSLASYTWFLQWSSLAAIPLVAVGWLDFPVQKCVCRIPHVPTHVLDNRILKTDQHTWLGLQI